MTTVIRSLEGATSNPRMVYRLLSVLREHGAMEEAISAEEACRALRRGVPLGRGVSDGAIKKVLTTIAKRGHLLQGSKRGGANLFTHYLLTQQGYFFLEGGPPNEE